MKHQLGQDLELDEKDRLILSQLQSDARLSLTDLGKKVGLTRMSVFNRVKNLRDAGVIEGTYCKVNPQKVNRNYLMVVQISCEVSGPSQEKVATKVAALLGVQVVYLNFGPTDILVIARRSDKEAAKDLLYEISRVPGVRNTLTMIPHTVIKETLDLDFDLGGTGG
jgi:DNA-binding Lrp family transcriptional regulator